MRWFVEISPLGTKSGQDATLCVEAPQWQPALQKARTLRNDSGALSNFSIELLEDGYRAIDPMARLRYVVKRAPDDAPLTNGAVTVPPPSQDGDPPKRASAPTVAFISSGEAQVTSPEPESQPEPQPEPQFKKRPPAPTMAFSSSGSAHVTSVEDPPRAEPVAPEPIPPEPPARPTSTTVPVEPLPSFVLVGSREDNPSDSSPLTYREYVYAVAEGTPEGDAKRLIFERFEHVRSALDPTRTGKLVNLAVFDHVFHGRPQRRPVVTLTWKDWKADEPEIRFPLREALSIAPPSPESAAAALAETPTPLAARSSSPAPAPAPVVVPAPAAVVVPAPAAVVVPAPAPPAPVTMGGDPPNPPAQPAVEPVSPEPAPARRSTAPASRRLAGDDLLSELFEAFGDLHFARDSLEGAEFVLNLTLEKLPSEVGLVSLFDMNKREFVIVRQSGGPRRALGARQAERAPLAITAMRKRHAIVVADAAEAEKAMDDRWRAIGVELKSLVCAPIELSGRFLGLIELANPIDGHAFNEGDGNALTYIGQQFAEFVAAHGVIVDQELIDGEPPPPAPPPARSSRAPSASKIPPSSKKKAR
jgi:hypothetical protein